MAFGREPCHVLAVHQPVGDVDAVDDHASVCTLDKTGVLGCVPLPVRVLQSPPRRRGLERQTKNGSTDVSVGRFHGFDGHFWAAADAAGRSLTCPLPAERVHRGPRVKGGRRPSQRDTLAPLTREGCTRRRRGPDLHARTGTQSRCSEIDPRKRQKSLFFTLFGAVLLGSSTGTVNLSQPNWPM